jgi:hypothetical protein
MTLSDEQRAELHGLRDLGRVLTRDEMDWLGVLALAADGHDLREARDLFRRQGELRRADETRRTA